MIAANPAVNLTPNSDLYYSQVERLIYKISHMYSAKTGLELDECIGEGNLAYAKALQSYRPHTGVKFGTYLYRCVVNALNDLARRQSRHSTNQSDNSELTAVEDRSNRWQAIMQDLSDDARLIVLSVISGPDDLKDWIQSGKQGRRRLMVWWKKQGWAVSRILRAFDEIQDSLVMNRS